MIANQFCLLSPCKHLVIWCHHVVVSVQVLGLWWFRKFNFLKVASLPKNAV